MSSWREPVEPGVGRVAVARKANMSAKAVKKKFMSGKAHRKSHHLHTSVEAFAKVPNPRRDGQAREPDGHKSRPPSALWHDGMDML